MSALRHAVVATLGGALLAVPALPAAAAVPSTPLTYAGTGVGDGGAALTAYLRPGHGPRHVATDGAGNLYIPDPHAHSVRRVDAETGIITRFAGTGVPGSSGDGGPAAHAQLDAPVAVAFAGDGALLVADRAAARIRRIAADGTITTLAGTGESTLSAVPVPAATAAVAPRNLYVAPDGAVYVVEPHTVRKIADGTISRVAGQVDGAGTAGDGGPAVDAHLAAPADVVADGDVLYVADGERVRRIGIDGVITTVAGKGGVHFGGEPGDGGPATEAYFSGLGSVAVRASDGAILAADLRSGVRAFVPGGTIDVVAPLPCRGTAAAEPEGTFLVACDHEVRRVAADGSESEVLAGTATGAVGDGLPATEAWLDGVRGLAAGADGSLYVAEVWGGRVRRVAPDGTIATVAGSTGRAAASSGDGGPAIDAVLRRPTEVAVAPDGTLYVGDATEHTVRKVATDGTITTLATGELSGPVTLAATSAGVDVGDTGGARVLHVATDGTVTTVAGGGTLQGRAAAGQAATAARVAPRSVARTPAGELLVLSGEFLYTIAGGVVTTVVRVGGPALRVGVDFAGRTVVQFFSQLTWLAAGGALDELPVSIGVTFTPGWAVLPDGRVAYADDGGTRPRVVVTTPAWGTRPPQVAGLRVENVADPPKAYWTEPAGWGDTVAIPVLLRGTTAPRLPSDGFDARYYGDGAAGGVTLAFGEDGGGLAYGDTYTLAVFSYSPSTATYSAPVVTTFQPRLPPPAATGLELRPGVGEATVRWTNPTSGSTGVVVRMAAGSTAPTATTGTQIYAGTGTSVVRRGLAIGQTYSFAVFTRNAAGDHSAPLRGTLTGTTVSIRRSASTVGYLGTVTMSGALRSSAQHATGDQAVQLLGRRLGTSRWVSLGYRAPTATGAYSFSHRPAHSTEYQVKYPGFGARLGSFGKATVKVRTRVTAAASRTSVPLGGGVAIRGQVAPLHAGQGVTVQRYAGGAWHTVGYATLSTTSVYSFGVTPPSRGRYYYRVVKRADIDHAESISPTVRFDVT